MTFTLLEGRGKAGSISNLSKAQLAVWRMAHVRCGTDIATAVTASGPTDTGGERTPASHIPFRFPDSDRLTVLCKVHWLRPTSKTPPNTHSKWFGCLSPRVRRARLCRAALPHPSHVPPPRPPPWQAGRNRCPQRRPASAAKQERTGRPSSRDRPACTHP